MLADHRAHAYLVHAGVLSLLQRHDWLLIAPPPAFLSTPLVRHRILGQDAGGVGGAGAEELARRG